MSKRLGFVVLVVAIGIARAGGARADGIVLEAYTGERPADAARLLMPIVEELTRLDKAISGEQLRLVYESSVSKPARTSEGLSADFADQIDRGFRAWVGGNFEEAIRILGAVTDAARANSGVFARDQTLREPLRKALIALALSEQRVGDLAAMRGAFVELLHCFPDAQVARATYGPEAFAAFDEIRRNVAAAGEGKLAVKVAQDGGAVFVNEAYRAMGSSTLSLPPGDYRVLVMFNKEPSRAHYVSVRAGGETTVAIDAELDQAIHTRGWTGLVFATDAARDAHEATFAAALANSVKAPLVAVIGIEQVKGHTAIVGSLVSLETGREIRRASVALDPDPTTDRLKALARFLAGEAPDAGLEVLVFGSKDGAAAAGADNVVQRGAPALTRGRWGGWKYTSAVSAAGALGAGVYLAIEDGKCQEAPQPGRPCSNVYTYAPYQYVALGVGALLTAATIYLVATLEHERDGPGARAAAFVAPITGGALAGYSLRW